MRVLINRYAFNLVHTTADMRYRVVKIELKDDENVVVYLKKEGTKMQPIPKFDLTDPSKIVDFGVHMGLLAAKSFEELTRFDAYITIEYDQYNQLDLKVGDLVEIEIRHACGITEN